MELGKICHLAAAEVADEKRDAGPTDRLGREAADIGVHVLGHECRWKTARILYGNRDDRRRDAGRKTMTEMVDKLSDDVTPEFRKFLHEAPHEWSPEVMAEMRRLMPRGIFNSMSMCGTAEQIVARLKSLAAVGVQETIMWPFPKPGQEVEDLLIQLAHSVLPHVAERPQREAYRLVD